MRAREREKHAGLNVPHKQNVMFGTSYLHVCDSRVRLTPSEMDYDIFAPADTEFAAVTHSVRPHKNTERETELILNLSRLVYLLHGLILSVFVRFDTANATKPKGCPSNSVKSRHFRTGASAQ